MLIETKSELFWEVLSKLPPKDRPADRDRFRLYFLQFKSLNNVSRISPSGCLRYLVQTRRVICKGNSLVYTDHREFDRQIAREQRKTETNESRGRKGIPGRDQLEASKGGMEIAGNVTRVTSVNKEVVFVFHVKNRTQEYVRTLIDVRMVEKLPEFSIHCSVDFRDEMLDFDPGAVFQVRVHCKGVSNGFLRNVVLFQFDGFSIGRFIEVSVEDDLKYDPSMAPKSKYIKWVPKILDVNEIIPGEPLQHAGGPNKVSMGSFHIPTAMKACFMDPKMENAKRRFLAILKEALSLENHQQRFSMLLHLEEIQMSVDIKRYSMDNAVLERSKGGHMLRLFVPGLAEKRPSVLLGDCVYVVLPQDKVKYQGYVHEVELNAVMLKFNPVFHKKYITGQKCNVEFSFSRTTLRREHHALTLSKSLKYLVLPPPRLLSDTLAIPKLASPFNRNLNQKQTQAVSAILEGRDIKPYMVPYIIFGPPGTGKTSTVIELLLQLWSRSYKYKERVFILACAPSNSAADLLVERLSSNLNPKEMLRLNGFQRPFKSVSQSVLNYSAYDRSDKVFLFPASSIKTYTVVVSTCSSAALLQLNGIGEDHFTHIVVDEAGHATEPESLIPVAGLSRNAKVILAGDPRQLGPVIRSQFAQKLLEVSLQERLLNDFTLFERNMNKFPSFGGYNPWTITKLVDNYRCHPACLKLPSRMFYDDELKAAADPAISYALCRWEYLPKRDFPLIFHGVAGKDEQEGRNPSWFNRDEAAEVYRYVEKLFEKRTHLSQSKIGVISPYQQQVQKIRSLLGTKGFPDIKVGTVEEFQGQERDVIIISTVRSNVEHLQFDFEHNLGFLKNPKRFNVAITRAKSLIIMVGNPNVLQEDGCWNELLVYCRENGGYTGCAFKPKASVKQEIQEAFQRLTVGITPEDAPWEEGQ